jgi:membrane fusion protein (multidrug efflux system)
MENLEPRMAATAEPARELRDGSDKPIATPAKPSRFRIVLIVIGLVVLVAALVWLFNWWTVGRFVESTNDAYLRADTVIVAPKVSGYVAEVYVADNQTVKAGDPLVRLDNRQYQASADQSQATIDTRQADIARAEAEMQQQKANIDQARAQREIARVNVKHASAEVDRYAPLAESGAETTERLSDLRNTLAQANATLTANDAAVTSAERQIAVMQAQVAQARAQLEAAQAAQRQSNLDMHDTVVYSALDGRIGDRAVRVGQYVQPGTRMMSVVPVQNIYLTANFKETQVGQMRAGQPATIYVDALGGTALHGVVQSFSPGTGSEFALLPPDNATGNFTKIVQRVPVRIRIDTDERTRAILLPGLSVNVDVDTKAGADDVDRIKHANEKTNG